VRSRTLRSPGFSLTGMARKDSRNFMPVISRSRRPAHSSCTGLRPNAAATARIVSTEQSRHRPGRASSTLALQRREALQCAYDCMQTRSDPDPRCTQCMPHCKRARAQHIACHLQDLISPTGKKQATVGSWGISELHPMLGVTSCREIVRNA
jgi:hypothetical protein